MELYKIHLDVVTLEDCLDLFEKKEVRTVLVAGAVIGFEMKK